MSGNTPRRFLSPRQSATPSDQSDYMNESAIDDDDEDSEWEDSIENSSESSVDDSVTFERVPAKVNLPSQQSLISLMFAGQEQRAKGLGNHTSKSTSALTHTSTLMSTPNDPDDRLEMKRGLRTQLNLITNMPRTSAQPILTNTRSSHQAVLSPRTTRRNMLATELTESLRRQLLWERYQKDSTANAMLKRHHISHDAPKLRQDPEQVYMAKTRSEANPSSLDRDFTILTMGGFHAQGW